MSNSPRRELIAAMYVLSRTAPQQWQEFEQAFRAYVAGITEDAVKAQPDFALIAHGRAQAMLSLRDDFQNIEANYKAIEKIKSR